MLVAWLAGLRIGIALIMAIGAQNAFVLRQGLRREHVLAVALFCAVSDAVLIAVGVLGLRAAQLAVPWLAPVLRWGGVAFLTAYGARAFLAAWRGGGALAPAAAGGQAPLLPVLATVAVLTWANPHVWLDTVVLIGSVAVQYPGHEAAFGAGAATGSLVFFLALGFGARALAPVFARPKAWVVLDLLVGVMMWSVAASLAFG